MPAAAISLVDGRVVADPFRPATGLAAHLRLHRSGWRTGDGRDAAAQAAARRAAVHDLRRDRGAHGAHRRARPATLEAARALLDDVFEGDMTDHDWEHALGGVHALAWEGTS